MTDDEDLIRVGAVGEGTEPEALPSRDHCGHCSDGWLRNPQPFYWLRGEIPGPQRIAFTQVCAVCELPTVVAFTAVPGDDGRATARGVEQHPPAPAPPLGIPEYAGTNIETYFNEAWRCRVAKQRRAAMVMARSTLQACFRRYLAAAERGTFTMEMSRVAALAGPGWEAVGVGVRDFGNQWAHPEGATDPPTWAEVRHAFYRMKAVLDFTAAMEKVGHLTPAP